MMICLICNHVLTNQTMTIHLKSKVVGYMSLLVKLELALKTTCEDFFTLVVHEKNFYNIGSDCVHARGKIS